MSLFGDERKTDERWMGFSESEYSYLRRSSSPIAHNVRTLLEACLEKYPLTEQSDLISRIRSKRGYYSATFELILHEWLRRQGYALAPHPVLPNGEATHPDFLVTCPDGSQLYLEAICTKEDDGRNPSPEALKTNALDVLYRAHHPDFLIGVTSIGNPITQPSGRKLRDFVITWLNKLDINQIIHDYSGNIDAYPVIHWRHECWDVEIRAIPFKDKEDNPARGLFGTFTPEGKLVNGWKPIRDAINKKTHKYGNLDLPIVVAVNIQGIGIDRMDEIQSLYGQEQVLITEHESKIETIVSHMSNGAWRKGFDRHFEKCSGAWLFDNFTPFTFAHRRQTLYLNPKATLPVPAGFIQMPYAQFESGELTYHEGKTFKEVFVLSELWPE